MIATSIVDWGALGEVVVYSLVAGVTVPAIFALSIRAAARSSEPRRGGFEATFYALLALTGALTCLAAVAYGIWLMADK